ncbi:MAG TPA: lysophospholipid acyltransferase family protein [Polyangiaceae bacterium]|nr:lysophospholipid acyltransferase family protein [Polyangiaceae bacterium]
MSMSTHASRWLTLPPLDGYEPSVRAQQLYCAVERIAHWLDVRIDGIDHIPDGRALLVANHAFGWDVLFVMARLFRERGRTLWALGEHAFWKFPGLRRLARDLGTVDGSPHNLDELLERDQAVLVLPGGLREAVKPRELRYRLLWGQRHGFVRAAVRHRAPIVPMACVGSDELFDFVGDAFARGERWLGRRGIPIPLPARLVPWPRSVALEYIIGEPLAPGVGPEQQADEAALHRLRHEVAGALHELLDRALARRAGIEAV